MILFISLLLSLTACFPRIACTNCASSTTSGLDIEQFFFSSEAWGGLPFSQVEKQTLLVKAVSAKSLERIEIPVAYSYESVDASTVDVVSFVAIYEVDAFKDFPNIRSGYVLEIDKATTVLPQRVRVVNEETGVSRVVRLEP